MHILVISPLSALMDNQVKALHGKGLSAVQVSSESEDFNLKGAVAQLTQCISEFDIQRTPSWDSS